MEKVIEIDKLVKQYGKLTAVNGISFQVNKGEVFGLLGENGAGKTTTLEIIEGLRKPTSGKVTVLGHDVLHELACIKEKIGVQLQSSAYFDFLTLQEILELFGDFYSRRANPADLLEMVALQEKSGSYVASLSGGQRQRFSIVAALVNEPEIVFLDEPTTGLDPIARRHLWDLIADIKQQGKTIILTTHYMEEAEMLCDRIAIMEKGEIMAMGETHKLIEQAESPFKITFLVSKIHQDIFNKLSKLGRVKNIIGKGNHFEIGLRTRPDLNTALDLVQKLNPEDLQVSRATLEDLFIELTGKTIGEQDV